MKTIRVELGERSYPILIGTGLLTSAAIRVLEIVRPSHVAILTHPALSERYAEPIRAGFNDSGVAAQIIQVAAGERHKNLRTIARLYDALLDAGIDRRGLLVTVGGGVLGDVGGFVAATFMRGISFVQVPTTLLAQVDASVGGKTGVDLPRGKNLVGAFHQPRAVIIDVATLATLPARELRSGLAEVLKHGIICDGPFLDRTVDQVPRLVKRDARALEGAVARSCEIKAEVVAQDEVEQGRRAILNFGHTVGHALESVTGYRRYKHGEAVAIGMVAAARIAEAIGLAAPDTLCRTESAVRSAGLPFSFPSDVSPDRVLEAMGRDKKTVGGTMRFVLPRRIGDVVVTGDVPESAVRAALAAGT